AHLGCPSEIAVRISRQACLPCAFRSRSSRADILRPFHPEASMNIKSRFRSRLIGNIILLLAVGGGGVLHFETKSQENSQAWNDAEIGTAPGSASNVGSVQVDSSGAYVLTS